MAWQMKFTEVVRNNDRVQLTISLLLDGVEVGQTSVRHDGSELPTTSTEFITMIKAEIEPFRQSLAKAVAVGDKLVVGATVAIP